jgi:DNA-binding transcriptional LysR family regulator
VQLHRLEGFFWVAREGGYARAARAFPYPITQPGVFQQVSRLERDLGTVLFERVGKDAVRLTAAGEHLYQFCAPFFEELPQVVRAIEARTYGGTLAIDSSPLLIRWLLPEWLGRLRAARPEIHVDIEETLLPDVQRLRTGAADLIVDFVPKIPPGYASRQVATTDVFLVLPKSHALGRRRRVTVQELRGELFISYHRSLPHHALQMAALDSAGVLPDRTLSATSVDSILSFVAAGLGYSIVPWLDRHGPRLDGVVVHRQDAPEGQFAVHAVWRETKLAKPLLDALLEVAPKPRAR